MEQGCNDGLSDALITYDIKHGSNGHIWIFVQHLHLTRQHLKALNAFVGSFGVIDGLLLLSSVRMRERVTDAVTS